MGNEYRPTVRPDIVSGYLPSVSVRFISPFFHYAKGVNPENVEKRLNYP